MTRSELRVAVIDIMTEVKLVTGALIYTDPRELEAQVQVIMRALISGFGMLTKEEVVHAFYLNMNGKFDQVYRHYNRELNAEFMGDVLRAYLVHKLYVRETKGPAIAAALKPPATAPGEARTVDLEFWKQMIQAEYDDYRFNRESLQFWHPRKYYTLRQTGLLPFTKGFKTWVYFFKKAMQGNVHGTTLPDGADIRHYTFRTCGECLSIFKNDRDRARAVDYLRRYAYWYVLRACRDCGVNDLFTEIQATR